MPSEPQADDVLPSLVVGIGASAGGLAAFKTFLANTPADIGMALILVQHLDPQHKSLLVELLGAGAPIPVLEAADGVAIRKNCAFVIPPNSTLTIRDGVLRVVSPAPPRELRRPIDTFFSSLAEDCGDKAVGIVLSGVGSDGALGVRKIKEHGGLTLAQAEFDRVAQVGMPQSAAVTGMVDHIVLVEAMPALLVDHQQHMGAFAEHKPPVFASPNSKFSLEAILRAPLKLPAAFVGADLNAQVLGPGHAASIRCVLGNRFTCPVKQESKQRDRASAKPCRYGTVE
jgi:two-component system CheB/CheR fusion protein